MNSPSGDPDGAAQAAKRSRRLVVAVDIVVLTVHDAALKVLLIRRLAKHHTGEWALPGGFVGTEESLDDAARRELLEETGVDLDPSLIEQFRTYGEPDRDDREDRRVISVAYLAIQPHRDLPELTAGTDAGAAGWTRVADVLESRRPVAFDHSRMIRDAVDRVARQLEYTALATAFVPARFTEAELRTVFDAVWGLPDASRHVMPDRSFPPEADRSAQSGPAAGDVPPDEERSGSAPLDPPNFHRSLLMLDPPIVARLGVARPAPRGRPATLFTTSEEVREQGPLMRLERPIAKPRRRATAPPRDARSAQERSSYKRRPN
jgi:8-oxo-dGTP diphosphatase